MSAAAAISNGFTTFTDTRPFNCNTLKIMTVTLVLGPVTPVYEGPIGILPIQGPVGT